MAKMKGNLKRVGTQIPGAEDWHSPPKGQEGYDRLSGSETTYYDGQLRPGPRLKRPSRRGRRISKMRTGNDAAMALQAAMEDTVAPQPGRGGGTMKGSVEWMRSMGYHNRCK